MAAIVHGYELDDDVRWSGSAKASTIDAAPIAPEWSENPSAEGFTPRVESSNSFGEVREAYGSYRVGIYA